MGSCVASPRSASRANEKARSEVTSPPLIKAVWCEAGKRNRGGALDAVTLSINVAEYPLRPVKALSTFFPRKNENVNNFKMIQCHCGMEKGHAAEDHLSFCRFKELFSYYIF